MGYLDYGLTGLNRKAGLGVHGKVETIEYDHPMMGSPDNPLV